MAMDSASHDHSWPIGDDPLPSSISYGLTLVMAIACGVAAANLAIDPSGSSGQSRVRFRSGQIAESGTALASPLPEACCYFCRRIPRAILLVFVLVSAAIDDKSGFKFKWLWL